VLSFYPMSIGAPGRIRTCNPRLRRPVLYPLSYGRNFDVIVWSGQQDLNLRPSAPKADALPDCAMPRSLFRRASYAGAPCRGKPNRKLLLHLRHSRHPWGWVEAPERLVRESATPR
jgi:hypothetical protein